MDNGRNGLFDFVKAHIKEARFAGLLGFIGSGTLLYTDGGNWKNYIGQWVIRFVFTILISIGSAVAAAWAKDWYENYKKYRALKNRLYEREKRAKRRKRA